MEGSEGGKDEAEDGKTATAKTKGVPSGPGPFKGHVGDGSSAWPLPAGGAQGLCINGLSQEAKLVGSRRLAESSSGLRSSEGTQAKQLRFTWER